jgi:hypothetical protein
VPTFRYTDFLSAEELSVIQDEIAAIMSDIHTGGTPITYQYRTTGGSATYNPVTGAITNPYTTKNLNVIMCTVTEADAMMARVDIESTTLKILVDQAALGTTPTSGDTVVHSSTVYEVVKVRFQPFTKFVVIYLKIQGGRNA